MSELQQGPDAVVLAEGRPARLEERLGRNHQDVHAAPAIVSGRSHEVNAARIRQTSASPAVGVDIERGAPLRAPGRGDLRGIRTRL